MNPFQSVPSLLSRCSSPSGIALAWALGKRRRRSATECVQDCHQSRVQCIPGRPQRLPDVSTNLQRIGSHGHCGCPGELHRRRRRPGRVPRACPDGGAGRRRSMPARTAARLIRRRPQRPASPKRAAAPKPAADRWTRRAPSSAALNLQPCAEDLGVCRDGCREERRAGYVACQRSLDRSRRVPRLSSEAVHTQAQGVQHRLPRLDAVRRACPRMSR